METFFKNREYNMKKILIGTSSFSEADPTAKNLLLESGFEVIDNPYKRKLSKNELINLLPGIDGLIAGLETLDEEVLSKSSLKVISRCGSGMSNVDLNVAKKLNIKVCNTPDGPVVAVAELTLTCMLMLLRKVSVMNCDLHSKKWHKKIGSQLGGKTVLIIGFGRIGRKVASYLKAFNAKVLVSDVNESVCYDSFSFVNLEDGIKKADIITIHASGHQCLLSENEFANMKNGVVLLNSGRGGLIDEQALIKALDNGKVRGAWLDTFTEEPYCGELCDYEQVILTPHVGSYTFECRKDMELQAVKNLIKSFN